MNPFDDPRALTCDSNSIRWEPSGRSAPASWETFGNVRSSPAFINRGQRDWTLVANNRPASGQNWASASPMKVEGSPGSPNSSPLTINYVVSAKNYYGSPVVGIGYQFRVRSDERCIDRLEIVPGKVEIASGWSVNLRVSIQEPRECGDMDSPIAVLPAQFFLVVETKLKVQRETKLHMVFPQSVLLV